MMDIWKWVKRLLTLEGPEELKLLASLDRLSERITKEREHHERIASMWEKAFSDLSDKHNRCLEVNRMLKRRISILGRTINGIPIKLP